MNIIYRNDLLTAIVHDSNEGSFGTHDRINIGYDKKLDKDMI